MSCNGGAVFFLTVMTALLLFLQRINYEYQSDNKFKEPDFSKNSRSGLVFGDKLSADSIEIWKRISAAHNRMGRFSNTPFHPFVPGHPTALVILSYQRCGSSFFGHLFNKNPDVFYIFEPIDSIYSAMYGTRKGWNVPSDITSYANGTERLLPKSEIDAVSEFLFHLLTCDTRRLPAEQLYHHYLFNSGYQRLNEYIRCISNRTVANMSKECFARAPASYCGSRFGKTSESNHEECHRLLTDSKFLNTHPNKTLFLPYIECRKKIRAVILKRCGKIFSSLCDNSRIRAVKTVRATMRSMEPLLSTVPNFRVIHLLRDPRPVMLSRQKFDISAQGMYSFDNRHRFNMSREAEIFCRTVYRDVMVRVELEKRFPGKIYPLFYEDVMTNLKVYSAKVYAFVNATSPVESKWWTRLMSKKTLATAKYIPHKWKSQLSVGQSKDISDSCAKLFRLVNKWEL